MFLSAVNLPYEWEDKEYYAFTYVRGKRHSCHNDLQPCNKQYESETRSKTSSLINEMSKFFNPFKVLEFQQKNEAFSLWKQQLLSQKWGSKGFPLRFMPPPSWCWRRIVRTDLQMSVEGIFFFLSADKVKGEKYGNKLNILLYFQNFSKTKQKVIFTFLLLFNYFFTYTSIHGYFYF